MVTDGDRVIVRRRGFEGGIRTDFENLTHGYLRLAEQADRNDRFGASHEPAAPKLGEPKMK